MSNRLGRRRIVGAAFLLGGLVAAVLVGGGSLAQDEKPPMESGPSYTGEHCSVTCGRFKKDTCEAWDPAGAPHCTCTVGDIGSYTECKCANGSTPTRCTCSSPPNAACNPENPQDGCGSCQCQC